jgi:hypothetical protein
MISWCEQRSTIGLILLINKSPEMEEHNGRCSESLVSIEQQSMTVLTARRELVLQDVTGAPRCGWCSKMLLVLQDVERASVWLGEGVMSPEPIHTRGAWTSNDSHSWIVANTRGWNEPHPGLGKEPTSELEDTIDNEDKLIWEASTWCPTEVWHGEEQGLQARAITLSSMG